MSNEENNVNEIIVSSKKRTKKQPIASVKPAIEDKIKSLQERGFNHDQIAAMLMCQKSLVKQVLG